MVSSIAADGRHNSRGQEERYSTCRALGPSGSIGVPCPIVNECTIQLYSTSSSSRIGSGAQAGSVLK